VENLFAQNEISRMMFNNQFSQQQQQQQQRINHNGDMNHVHPMSKFFDFHKQQQQNQFIMNSNPVTDQLNMANILDNHHRMNPANFMEPANGNFYLVLHSAWHCNDYFTLFVFPLKVYHTCKSSE
jgi:hypothetical protein